MAPDPTCKYPVGLRHAIPELTSLWVARLHQIPEVDDEVVLELVGERTIWDLLQVLAGPSAEDGTLVEV